MARNTQVIEVDLRSGIETDDSPLAIGPKLLESDEVGWQPFGLTDELRRRVLAFLPQRDLGNTILPDNITGPSGDILSMIALDANGDFPSGGYALVANPSNVDGSPIGQCTLFDFLGNVFSVGSTLTALKDLVRSGWMVVWTGIDKTTVFFGHPAFGSIWQVVAPSGAPTVFVPTISPFSGSPALDMTLDLTAISAVALAAGETALPTGTWKLQLVGTDANAKEINSSDETSGTVIGAGKALEFTVPDFTATYAHANLYAHKGADALALQLNDIRPGVYHLNGNGNSSSPPIRSIKLITTGTLANAALTLDAALDPQSVSMVDRTLPEKNLSSATYTVMFQARRIADGITVKSDISAAQVIHNQVIAIKTVAAGYDRIEVYTKKGTSGSAKMVRLNAGTTAPLTLDTLYHINLNASGTLIGATGTFTGIIDVLVGPPPGAAIANVIDGLIHLDRFWVLQSPGNGRSTAYYSDPIDKNTFRVESFVPIPADGTCMFRCNVGAIDPGAASHLLFGTTTSIWVLDGDPTTGSGVLRRLTFDVGIADRSCVAETSFGAVFLGTDGQFWLIPPGATQTVPLGHRMLTKHFNADFTAARSSLAWLSPYIVYSDNSKDVWFADLSPIISQKEPKWWGPVSPTPFSVDTGAIDSFVPDAVRLFGTTPEAGPSYSNSVFYGWTQQQLSQLDVITRGSTGTLTGRSAQVKTGFLSVEDHKVELMRVVVEMTAPEDDYPLSVSAITTKGTVVTVSRTVTGVAAPDSNILTKVVFDFASSPVVGDAFMLMLTWPETVMPDTHRAFAEVRLQPKQDS